MFSSKYAYAIPLKRKNATSVLGALKTVFKKLGTVKHIQSDKGREFWNSPCQRFFAQKGVNHYSSESEYKTSVVERFNRTLKNKLYRIFTYRNSFTYVDILNFVLKAYNSSVHRSTGFSPDRVTQRDESVIFERLYGYLKLVDHGYRVGDKVGISKAKKAFKIGYLPNWSEEAFEVHKCFFKEPTDIFTSRFEGCQEF